VETGIPIPHGFEKYPGITIHVESSVEDHITCVIVNNTDRSAWIRGGGLNLPVYRIQELSDNRWVEKWFFLACGVGLHTPRLSPHRACRFSLDLPETINPVRVGIALLDDVSV